MSGVRFNLAPRTLRLRIDHEGTTLMKKLLLGMLLALPIMLATPASALPGASHAPAMVDKFISSDLIEVRGGHGGGHGRGHAMRRGGGREAYGWSRGRKVGWRGHGCPPGLRMQGRC